MTLIITWEFLRKKICSWYFWCVDLWVVTAVGVVSPIDRTKTQRIHGSVIQPGYNSVSVDRVLKGYSNVPLDIEGGDGGEDTRRSREDIYSMAQTLHHHSWDATASPTSP